MGHLPRLNELVHKSFFLIASIQLKHDIFEVKEKQRRASFTLTWGFLKILGPVSTSGRFGQDTLTLAQRMAI